MTCDHCSTPIEPADLADHVHGGRFHYFCIVRMVVGSVGHQLQRCSCYGGDASDPPRLSRREAALAACYLNIGRHHGGFAEVPTGPGLTDCDHEPPPF